MIIKTDLIINLIQRVLIDKLFFCITLIAMSLIAIAPQVDRKSLEV